MSMNSLQVGGARRWALSAAAAILVSTAGCTVQPTAPIAPPVAAPPAVVADPPTTTGRPIDRANARWVPAAWNELPGWDADRTAELWPALLRSCDRPTLEWLRVCADARKAPPASDEAARAFLQQRLQPYRVESSDGAVDGMLTGYFEPLIESTRQPSGAFRVPLYRAPADLPSRRPYWTRQQIDTLPAAQRGLRGSELAYVADPLDALILQIQGSGRLQITEADGTRRTVRVAFAGHNDQPYKSVGRWLIEQGELRPEQASWPGIKAWAQRNPKRINELLWANPRFVFFREEALPDPSVGPKGAQGVPLTPGRSIAVDRDSIPYGTPVWLSTTEPQPWSPSAPPARPLQRLVLAQDTGTAIVGAVRADYFWGWGDSAEASAGITKQPLRLWVLWPR